MPTLQDVAGDTGIFTDGNWILSENMDANGKYGVIQLKHVGIGEFLAYKDFNFINQKTFNDLRCTEVLPGDVLISRMADPIGRACIVPQLPFPCVTAVDVTIVRIDKSIAEPEFIMHLCNSPSMREKIDRAVRGTTRARITRTELGELEIPLPLLTEQKRIASLLARADRLRSLRRTAHDLGESLLQSVFLEMFGDYLNKIECQFGDVLEIPLTNGFFEKNDKYGKGTPIVWVDNLYHTNIIDTKNLRRVQVTQKDLEKYAVIEGDLLFTRSSLVAEGVGRANIVPKLEEQTMFESHVIRARVDKKKLNPFFALGLFRSQFGISEMMKRAKTATMTTIGQDTLYEFPCMLPPLSLQEEFAGVVARVESLRGRMGESTRQVEGLFESLLAEAFDGHA